MNDIKAHYPIIREYGPLGFKNAKIQKKDSNKVSKCEAVALMFNPVTFGREVKDKKRKNEKDVSVNDNVPETLKVVFEILGHLISKESDYIRIYNATTTSSWNRIEMLKKPKSDNDFPKDQDLCDGELSAPWWIAWGSESNYPDKPCLAKIQCELLKNRWCLCINKLGKPCGTAIGFQLENNSYALIAPRCKKSIDDSCDRNKYLHPTRLIICKKEADDKNVIDNKEAIKKDLKDKFKK